MHLITCDISWDCAAQVAVFQFFMNSVRYFPLAGGLLLITWIWKRTAAERFRIQQRYPEAARIWFEVRRSLLTLLVFTGLGVFSMISGKLGYTQVYVDIDRYGVAYLFFSFALLVIWQETFFYWTHRWMHKRPWFNWIHRTHHISTNPSPMAAYSFSLSEAIIEGAYLVIFIFLVPIHPIAALSQVFYAMIMNIWWHSGLEIFPSGWTAGRATKWINSSTHHNMHHSHFSGNYSLYFNFWDRMCGTNFPHYEAYFESVAARRDGCNARNADREEEPATGGLSPDPQLRRAVAYGGPRGADPTGADPARSAHRPASNKTR